MTELQYELLAGAMRFVFVPLILFILYRCARNAWIEYRYEKTHVGDVGTDGEVMGYAALIDEWQDEDAWRPLYDDAVIGSASDCNFRVRGHGLRPKHARIYFERGRAYIERLCTDSDTLEVDGQPVIQTAKLHDGVHILAGEAEMLVTFRERRTNPDEG